MRRHPRKSQDLASQDHHATKTVTHHKRVKKIKERRKSIGGVSEEYQTGEKHQKSIQTCMNGGPDWVAGLD